MTIAARETLQVKGLGREKLHALTRKAQHMGMTPERYVKWLVEEDLAIAAEAQRKTFAQIMGPGRVADETKLDALVEAGRVRHHQKISKKKR